jgi:hypothetical protein
MIGRRTQKNFKEPTEQVNDSAENSGKLRKNNKSHKGSETARLCSRKYMCKPA